MDSVFVKKIKIAEPESECEASVSKVMEGFEN
jgi:hypothetical protein